MQRWGRGRACNIRARNRLDRRGWLAVTDAVYNVRGQSQHQRTPSRGSVPTTSRAWVTIAAALPPPCTTSVRSRRSGNARSDLLLAVGGVQRLELLERLGQVAGQEQELCRPGSGAGPCASVSAEPGRERDGLGRELACRGAARTGMGRRGGRVQGRRDLGVRAWPGGQRREVRVPAPGWPRPRLQGLRSAAPRRSGRDGPRSPRRRSAGAGRRPGRLRLDTRPASTASSSAVARVIVVPRAPPSASGASDPARRRHHGQRLRGLGRQRARTAARSAPLSQAAGPGASAASRLAQISLAQNGFPRDWPGHRAGPGRGGAPPAAAACGPATGPAGRASTDSGAGTAASRSRQPCEYRRRAEGQRVGRGLRPRRTSRTASGPADSHRRSANVSACEVARVQPLDVVDGQAARACGFAGRTSSGRRPRGRPTARAGGRRGLGAAGSSNADLERVALRHGDTGPTAGDGRPAGRTGRRRRRRRPRPPTARCAAPAARLGGHLETGPPQRGLAGARLARNGQRFRPGRDGHCKGANPAPLGGANDFVRSRYHECISSRLDGQRHPGSALLRGRGRRACLQRTGRVP